MDDKALLKLAEEELLNEAKKAAVRYSVSGPSGWQPCPLHKTNKRFLANTLLQTLSSNRKRRSTVKTSKEDGVKDRKLLQFNIKEGHNYIYKKSQNTEALKSKKTDQKISSNKQMQQKREEIVKCEKEIILKSKLTKSNK